MFGVKITGITVAKQYTMQMSLILKDISKSDAFFYEDLLTFLLKSTENIVRSDVDDGDGDGKLRISEGVWKIRF